MPAGGIFNPFPDIWKEPEIQSVSNTLCIICGSRCVRDIVWSWEMCFHLLWNEQRTTFWRATAKLYISKVEVTKCWNFHLKTCLKAAERGVVVQLMTWGYYPDIQNSFPPGKTPGLKNISKRTFPKDLIWNVGSRCWIRLYRLSCHWPWILECPNWHELSAADSISTNSADFIQLCELEFLANEFDGGRWGEVW